MTTLADALGRTLREARRARGLTLREAAARSDGRFRPTSIAGYERGERSISVERLVELARIYDRPPVSLLDEALRGTAPVTTIHIPDLDDPEAPQAEPQEPLLVVPSAQRAAGNGPPETIRSP